MAIIKVAQALLLLSASVAGKMLSHQQYVVAMLFYSVPFTVKAYTQ